MLSATVSKDEPSCPSQPPNFSYRMRVSISKCSLDTSSWASYQQPQLTASKTQFTTTSPSTQASPPPVFSISVNGNIIHLRITHSLSVYLTLAMDQTVFQALRICSLVSWMCSPVGKVLSPSNLTPLYKIIYRAQLIVSTQYLSRAPSLPTQLLLCVRPSYLSHIPCSHISIHNSIQQRNNKNQRLILCMYVHMYL